jgi:hypothetical protein
MRLAKHFMKWLPLAALVGCGPTAVKLEPSAVRSVEVRPANGQRTFCPGEPFEVEVRAELATGETCSSRTPGRCNGKDDALLDRRQLGVTVGIGEYDPVSMIAVAPADALATADGMPLHGWIVGAESQKSTITLEPVYGCLADSAYRAPTGARGPQLEVAAAFVATPYYPEVLLVRIRAERGLPRYVMAQPGDRVRIVAAGGPGATGEAGAPGTAGVRGQDATTPCTPGGAGGPGTSGGPGGPGGDGGPGGAITLVVDARAAERIVSMIELYNPGGAPGAGGYGGTGGAGGEGGRGGPSDTQQCSSGGPQGPHGTAGSAGPSGPMGRGGPPGPTPIVQRAQRDAMFAAELPRLRTLEAGAKRR